MESLGNPVTQVHGFPELRRELNNRKLGPMREKEIGQGNSTDQPPAQLLVASSFAAWQCPDTGSYGRRQTGSWGREKPETEALGSSQCFLKSHSINKSLEVQHSTFLNSGPSPGKSRSLGSTGADRLSWGTWVSLHSPPFPGTSALVCGPEICPYTSCVSLSPTFFLWRKPRWPLCLSIETSSQRTGFSN